MESRYDRSISHVIQVLMKIVFIYALQMELPSEQGQPKQTENAPSFQQTSAETLVRSAHLKGQILVRNQGNNHVCYSKRSLSWTTHLYHRCPRHQPSGMMRKRQAFPGYIQIKWRVGIIYSVLIKILVACFYLFLFFDWLGNPDYDGETEASSEGDYITVTIP